MKLLFLLFISIPIFAFNFSLSNGNIANGATSLITFKKEINTQYKNIVLGKKTYPIYTNPFNTQEVYALIPISYYEKRGHKMAKVVYIEHGFIQSKEIALTIEEGNYKKENIKVASSKVNPSKKDTKRISKEYHQAMKIYAKKTKRNYLKSKFILPLESFITSDFGKARVYNDTLKGYHSGTDFRAAVGTPIIASNDGRVVLVKNRFYSGGTVIIDHGHGIYTCYYHMSKFDVRRSMLVKKGDIIGLSGKSGRVTGPHLHFSVRVSGVQVDPLQFLELMNTKLIVKNKGKQE